MGLNNTDFVEAGLQVTALPLPLLTLQPELVWLKQGEGDPRAPVGTPPIYGPTFFEGTPQTTWRLAVSGRAQVARRWDVDADAGLHLTQNTGHQPGVNGATFVGRFAISYRLFDSALLEH